MTKISSSFFCRINKDERQINVRKSRRDIKDSKNFERQLSDSLSSTVSPPSINNNVNKNSPNGKPDKSKSPKSSSSDNQTKSIKMQPSDTKTYPEPRARSHDKPTRHYVESIALRDYKPAVAEIEELKQSIATVQEKESENQMNLVKDFKDVKSKSKRKSKTANKRDESKNKPKDKNTKQQGDPYEGACSDDSSNESYSERVTLGIRLDVSGRNSPRSDSSNRTTNEKTRSRKNQISPCESKGKKQDHQSKSKLDLTAKNKDRISALQAESRDLGPNSPHAIAAAVMSHLEKSLQTSIRDNSYEEGEGRKKAFSKISNRYTDSPPLVSPTNLSGSSRSSSHSSIVSSDSSSSGSDQGKGSLAKALKHRLKPSRSMPLGDQGSVYILSCFHLYSVSFLIFWSLHLLACCSFIFHFFFYFKFF